jgi:hypothetical protein
MKAWDQSTELSDWPQIPITTETTPAKVPSLLSLYWPAPIHIFRFTVDILAIKLEENQYQPHLVGILTESAVGSPKAVSEEIVTQGVGKRVGTNGLLEGRIVGIELGLIEGRKLGIEIGIELGE